MAQTYEMAYTINKKPLELDLLMKFMIFNSGVKLILLMILFIIKMLKNLKLSLIKKINKDKTNTHIFIFLVRKS